MPDWPFHVVLCQPQIPLNAGSIARTCVVTGCALHLIHPLGFRTSSPHYKRAGLDYWSRLSVVEHATWEAFLAQCQVRDNLWIIENGPTARLFWDAEFCPGDFLVFGSETQGVPREVVSHHDHDGRLLMLPMRMGERSLNLSNTVCAVVYEGLRQLHRRGALTGLAIRGSSA